MVLRAGHLLDKLGDRRLVRAVRCEGDNLTAGVEEGLAPGLGGGVECVGAAAGDVHARAVVGERAGDHEADAGAATGDNADPALDVEEADGGELGVLRRHSCAVVTKLLGSG